MGNLLGSPITDKDTHVGVSDCGVPYGHSSMQGWRIHMEDAHIIQPHLYAQEESSSSNSNTKKEYKKLPLPGHSLFAVFDGHGGSFAAEYAARNFCRVLSREEKFIEYANFVQERDAKEPTLNATDRAMYVRNGQALLEQALCDAFVTLDAEILRAIQGDSEPDANTPYEHISEDDKKDSSPQPFDMVVEELKAPEDEDSGTTICVLVLTPQWIVCANAGDSRAIYSKGGRAVPLSYDHKPDDEEEERRIKAAGGYVAGGRVEGDLAVSRGLGDYRFKVLSSVLNGNNPLPAMDDNPVRVQLHASDQKVSPVPDLIVQNRNDEQDEFIVMACDGIWDVQTNHECAQTIVEIFNEGESDLGLVCEEVRVTANVVNAHESQTFSEQ